MPDFTLTSVLPNSTICCIVCHLSESQSNHHSMETWYTPTSTHTFVAYTIKLEFKRGGRIVILLACLNSDYVTSNIRPLIPPTLEFSFSHRSLLLTDPNSSLDKMWDTHSMASLNPCCDMSTLFRKSQTQHVRPDTCISI